MQKIESLFADYASYHQTAGNKLFHRLGIPLIMLSGFGMLARLSLTPPISGMHIVDAATILIAAATIYYLIVEWRLGVLMMVASLILYAIGAALPMWLNITLFVLGWIFQFVGHSVYEHKQPAFMRNLLHLLVGPLWILNDIVPVVKRA